MLEDSDARQGYIVSFLVTWRDLETDYVCAELKSYRRYGEHISGFSKGESWATIAKAGT